MNKLFKTPWGTDFEVPQEWLDFSEVEKSPASENFYCDPNMSEVMYVPLLDIEPIIRDRHIRKHRFVPILLAISDPEVVVLPPVELAPSNNPKYKFKLKNGYHRFYASMVFGFTLIPAIEVEDF